jgi:hypothetical protein
MNTLGTPGEQVARLEALLKRVRTNAVALRNERASGEVVSAPMSLGPNSDSPASGTPVTAPTGTLPPRGTLGTLPDFLEQAVTAPPEMHDFGQVDVDPLALHTDDPVTQIPPRPEPLASALEAPTFEDPESSLHSLESDVPTLPPSRDDDIQDPDAEHTKPLWLGLNNGAGTFQGEGGYESRPGDSHRTLAETPAAKVFDTSGEFSTFDEASRESVALTSEDSLGGHRELSPPDVEVDVAAFDNGGIGEEEHLDTSPPISGHRASTRSPELLIAESLSPEDLEQELELGATHVDDSGGRISDAPPSVIGATITLPDESSAVSLELLEPPPSSFNANQGGAGGDDLEADLPRTSFRAEYDASLSSPPSAVDDLRAHEERRTLEQRTSRQPERVAISQRSEDDLPPVLSSRPAAPVGQANSVVYSPRADATGAVFEGERAPLPSMAFLALLDTSLSISVRG